jgi:secreted trypsin-like serine protease
MHRIPRAALILAITIAAVVLAASATAAPRDASSRIIGGAKPGDATYASQLASTVALVSMDAPSQYDGQFCGGTLIDELHVLTAAHCVVENDPYSFRVAPSSLRVLAGTRNLDERALKPANMVPVTTIFVNPNFNLNTFRYDAAVLRLARPITGVPLLPMLTDAESTALGIGTQEVPSRAAGWGDTDTSSDDCCFPPFLLTISMAIHTDATCRSNLEDSPTWRFDPTHQLCSGAVGRDTCQGDSGGPLIVNERATGAPRLAGIVSHGVGCGEGFYGIYARVNSLYGWVASIPGTIDGDARDTTHGPDDSIAPTITSATATGYSSVRMSVASNGGPAFTGYTAWLRSGSPSSARDIFLGRSTDPTFSVELPPRRTSAPYRVLVRGLTANGESPAASTQAGPRIDRMRPTAPRALAVSTRGNTLTVSWRRGVDRQSGVRGTQVQRRGPGGAWSRPQLTEPLATRWTGRAGSGGQVRIRTIDWAGNTSAWTRPVAY